MTNIDIPDADPPELPQREKPYAGLTRTELAGRLRAAEMELGVQKICLSEMAMRLSVFRAAGKLLRQMDEEEPEHDLI